MDILIKSIASGAVTAVILLVAKFAGPRLAGAIGGVPIVFAVTYVLLTMNNRSVAREFLVGGIYGAIAAIFFSLLLIWLNEQFLRVHWLNFIVAYILCFLVAFTLVHLSSKT